jgi:hypothetical protein
MIFPAFIGFDNPPYAFHPAFDATNDLSVPS